MEWMAQELMVQSILVDLFNSTVLNFDIEAEFRTLADEYPNKVYSDDFHKAPIWFDLGNYLIGCIFVYLRLHCPIEGNLSLLTIHLMYHTMRLFYHVSENIPVFPLLDGLGSIPLPTCHLFSRNWKI